MKKQSQFIEGQNNATSLQAMIYGDFNGRRLRKNKAKQTQFHAPALPKGAARNKSVSNFSGIGLPESLNFLMDPWIYDPFDFAQDKFMIYECGFAD